MKKQTRAEREAWLRRRDKGIGGSDVAAILGVSPWESAFELWARKLGKLRPQPQTDAMKRGLDLEPAARRSYELLTGILMPPAEIEHGRIKFMRGNFDGLNREAGRILEIKNPHPNGRDHARALAGEVPEYYVWQCRHLMAVADLPLCDYYSFDGWQGAPPITIKRDLRLEKELIEAERKFWRHVTEKTPPPIEIQIPKARKA